MQLKKLFTFFGLVSLFISNHYTYCVDAVEMQKYVQFDKNGKYTGLTEHAKKLITSSRDVLRKRKEAFNKKFKQFSTIYHAGNVNRLAKGNMYLYGPPGGAKSKFVSWLFGREATKPFELQMHEMLTEQAFIGGQVVDEALKGRFVVNTEGSLADYTVALIDEIDKGNPSALAALLSLLNERKIMAGNKVISDTKLETLFSTSNANTYELYQKFAENGLRTTAPALLNRFTTIAYVPNWLSKFDQSLLDKEWVSTVDDLFAGKNIGNSDESLVVDWKGLRELATYILRPTDEFMSVAREFVDSIRAATIDAVTAANDNAQLHYDDQAVPYYPTADFTERLRQRIYDIIIMSLMLDIIESPLVNNINEFENSLKKVQFHRLPIGPLSLWRSYLTLTTVSFGQVQLKFPMRGQAVETLDVDFGDFFAKSNKHAYKPKDKREEKHLEYIFDEQKRFKDIFLKKMQEHKEITSDYSVFTGMFACLNDVQITESLNDIERVLWVVKNVNKSPQ